MSFVSKPVRAVAATTSVVLTTLVLAGCPSQTAPPAVADITISGGDIVLVVGDDSILTAEISPPGADQGLAWESADTDVATVEGSGTSATVIAIASGPTTITATSTGDPSKSDTIQVTVVEPGSVLWTTQFGTDSIDEATGVEVDAAGRVLVAGQTFGALEGSTAVSADAYVRVHSADGEHLWTRQFGSGATDAALAVASDGDGNIYVAGYTFGDLEGASAGGQDAFVRKYDPNGDHLWTRQFGTSDADSGHAVTVDVHGNIYVAGATVGSLEGTSAGDLDAFVRKYGPDGSHLWTRQFGTPATDLGSGVEVARDGAVIIVGYTVGDLGGANAGGWDAFVRRYEADGSHTWTRLFGTSADEFVWGVAADANVVVVGSTSGHMASPSHGGYDAFVRTYDTQGDHLWTDQFGSPSHDDAVGANIDTEGNVAVVGSTSGTIAGTTAGGEDAFLRKYDSTGAELWTRQFGTSAYDDGNAVASGESEVAVVVGNTNGALVGTSAGSTDVYLRAYGP